MIKCPKCHKKASETDLFCLSCGAILPSVIYEERADGYVVVGPVSHESTFLRIDPSNNGQPVRYIGKCAFADETKLTSIIIPSGILAIEEEAFMGCASLPTLLLPGSVTSIGKRALFGAKSLVDLTLGNGLSTFGAPACYCRNNAYSRLSGGNFTCTCGAASYRNDLKIIEEEAFAQCSCLTSLTIPDGVKELKEGCFADCINLTNVTLPATLTSLASPFRGCEKLLEIRYNGSKSQLEEVNGNKTLLQGTKAKLSFLF